MSQAVGTIDPGFDQGTGHSGVPKLSVNGPWLDGTEQHRRNSPYRTFGKASDVGPPSPSDLWVLVDEDAHGLNDAAFAFQMTTPCWRDATGSYHNIGCGFAFADGHSETRRWLDASTRAKQGDVGTGPSDPAAWRDCQWLRARTSSM